MYRVLVTSQAKRDIKQLKKTYQKAIFAAFEELQETPRAGKPLTRELTGKYSYKISAYRIIYTINDDDQIVYILTAGHRSTIYK